jgi:hypothetical protein
LNATGSILKRSGLKVEMTEQYQSTPKHSWPNLTELVAVLSSHREEIAEARVLSMVPTLLLAEPTGFAEMKAQAPGFPIFSRPAL